MHFDKYKDHELIRFAQEIRDKNWIGFDAVMKMAIYLEQPPTLNPIVPFTDDVPDRRWGKGNANKFLKLLQQFYTDAKCDDFFNAHKDLYRLSEERYKNVYESIDLKWFTRYYGTEPKGSFNIIPGLGNGGGNYGVKAVLPNGKEAMYAIMQTSSIDSTDIPVYDVNFNLPTLIHEFNHSYVNDIQKKYEKDLENSGEKLYGIVAEGMRGQAYTDWKSVLNEAVDNDAKFGNSDITNLREGKMAAKDYIYYGATHEIGHTFLNPIMDNFNKQIDQIPLKYSAADPSKITFLCESFLRSLTAYFLIKNQYDEFAQMVIQGEKQQGYIYNELIVDLINDYANNRNIYKTFNDYIPVFLDKLKQEVENK
jgi:hypothetical protein